MQRNKGRLRSPKLGKCKSTFSVIRQNREQTKQSSIQDFETAHSRTMINRINISQEQKKSILIPSLHTKIF